MSSDYSSWVLNHTPEEMNHCLEIVKTIPYVLEIKTRSGKTIGVCHAQPPTDDWNDVHKVEYQNSIVWSRARRFTNNRMHVKNIDLTIHGHTPSNDPISLGNSLWIDTGACFPDGRLTELNINDL